jgi:uncharacterized protein involved in type VI secretion and phage assembly
MRTDYDDPRQPIYGMQIGVVTHREAGKDGRIRLRIPGLIEEASNWAWPLSSSGGGTEDEGFFNVPPIGAEVAVWFKNGHPDHPYYMPANWGVGEAPEASDGSDPDVKVLALKEYDVVVDTRATSKKLSIVDKASGTNLLEFNGVTRALKISATTGIEIESTGDVTINGLNVIINGIPAGLGQL